MHTLGIMCGIGTEVAELLSGRVMLPGPNLGETLVSRRLQLGATEAEMGRRSGMAGSQIAHYERGGAVPGIASICKLAKGYGLPLVLVLQASLTSENLLSASAPGAKPIPRNRVRK
ncbi:MAG: helix-turn-helix domain-containing protein [Gemmobacter sp.]